jgi:hypothetical protein
VIKLQRERERETVRKKRRQNKSDKRLNRKGKVKGKNCQERETTANGASFQ